MQRDGTLRYTQAPRPVQLHHSPTRDPMILGLYLSADERGVREGHFLCIAKPKCLPRKASTAVQGCTNAEIRRRSAPWRVACKA